MATLQEIQDRYIEALRTRYGHREAQNIWRWVQEEMVDKSVTDEVPRAAAEKLTHCLQRLKAGEPVQYVLGRAPFFDHMLRVTPDVLIPRPETEQLTQWAEETLQTAGPAKPSILDVGSGSGCIIIRLASVFPDSRCSATDLSEKALEVARANAREQGVTVCFMQQDILDRHRVNRHPPYDLIISNPPYVLPQEKEQLAPHVRKHEPEAALLAKDDALEYYRALARLAVIKLRPGRWLFAEIHEKQSEAVKEVFREAGLQQCTVKEDLQGKPRMVRAVKF